MKASGFVRVDYNPVQKREKHLFQAAIDLHALTWQNIHNIRGKGSYAMTMLRSVDAIASIRTAGASSIITILTVGVVGADANTPF